LLLKLKEQVQIYRSRGNLSQPWLNPFSWVPYRALP